MNLNDYINVGKRIENCRKEKKMTLDEVGKLLGMHRSSILRYEKGCTKQIKLVVIQRLAQILDTTPEYLMTGKNKTEDSSMLHSSVRYDSFSSMNVPIVFTRNELIPAFRESTLPLSFAYQMENDDFAPRIVSGDIMVLNRITTIPDGQIGMFLSKSDEVVLKRVYFSKLGVTLITNDHNSSPIIIPTLSSVYGYTLIAGVVRFIAMP